MRVITLLQNSTSWLVSCVTIEPILFCFALTSCKAFLTIWTVICDSGISSVMFYSASFSAIHRCRFSGNFCSSSSLLLTLTSLDSEFDDPLWSFSLMLCCSSELDCSTDWLEDEKLLEHERLCESCSPSTSLRKIDFLTTGSEETFRTCLVGSSVFFRERT